MDWVQTNRADARAALIADRHYSRQTIGARQFTPPGRVLVLVTPDYDALWATSWPYAEYVHREWADAWICTLFRNEAPDRYMSSALIRQAVAATRWYWPAVPPLGMITLIDSTKVRPIKRRGVPVWGWVYRKAGFVEIGQTKGGLIALQLAPAVLPDPIPPNGAQLRLLEDAA
jgi:hypothetical protein